MEPVLPFGKWQCGCRERSYWLMLDVISWNFWKTLMVCEIESWGSNNRYSIRICITRVPHGWNCTRDWFLMFLVEATLWLSPLDSKDILFLVLFYEHLTFIDKSNKYNQETLQVPRIKEPKTHDLDILQYKQKLENLQHNTCLISVVGSSLELLFNLCQNKIK